MSIRFLIWITNKKIFHYVNEYFRNVYHKLTFFLAKLLTNKATLEAVTSFKKFVLCKICKTHRKKLAIKTIFNTDSGLSRADTADHGIWFLESVTINKIDWMWEIFFGGFLYVHPALSLCWGELRHYQLNETTKNSC